MTKTDIVIYTGIAIVGAVAWRILRGTAPQIDDSVRSSNIPLSYYTGGGIPQMSTTGVPTITMPTSRVGANNITINNSNAPIDLGIKNQSKSDCCQGCGASGGNVIGTFQSIIDSIRPDAANAYVASVAPKIPAYKAPAIVAPVKKVVEKVFTPIVNWGWGIG